MWAVVGLGNPGIQYAKTRHNVGYLFVKRIARNWKVKLRRKIFLSKADYAEINGKKILLALPQTYMNNSGTAVREMITSGNIEPENLIIIYDDLDIPLGDIRVRKEGSAGSHKGMISIINHINTTHFPRIRIGIGPLKDDIDAAEYVLTSFAQDEITKIEISLPKAQDALHLILDGQIKLAMNRYNTRARHETEGNSVHGQGSKETEII